MIFPSDPTHTPPAQPLIIRASQPRQSSCKSPKYCVLINIKASLSAQAGHTVINDLGIGTLMNISGILVHSPPQEAHAVSGRIANITGMQVRASERVPLSCSGVPRRLRDCSSAGSGVRGRCTARRAGPSRRQRGRGSSGFPGLQRPCSRREGRAAGILAVIDVDPVDRRGTPGSYLLCPPTH